MLNLDATQSASESTALVVNSEAAQAVETFEPSTDVGREIIEAYPFEVESRQWGQTGIYAAFRTDTGECVSGAHSAKYRPHQREHLAALGESVAESLGTDCKVETFWSPKSGNTVILQPSDDYRRKVYGTDDSYNLLIRLNAPYNGTAVSCFVGIYRDRCANLELLDYAGSYQTRIRHDAFLSAKTAALAKRLSHLSDSFDSLGHVIDTMSQTSVNLETALVNIIPPKFKPNMPEVAENLTTNYVNKLTAIRDRISDDRTKGGNSPVRRFSEDVTLWDVVNGVQGHFQHSRQDLSRLDQINRASDTANIGGLVDYVRTTLSI